MVASEVTRRRGAGRGMVLTLLVLCGILFGACGGGGASNKSSATSSAAGATGPATGSSIKIGVITDIAGGPYVVTGASTRIATDMVVDDVNAHGGINGHKLEASFVDAKGDPALALTLATQLVQQDHVDVLIGGAGSPECLGIQGLAPKLGIVYLATNGCANEQFAAQSCNKYSFRIDPVGKQLVEPATDYLLKTYGKRWAIMYTDYAYGQSQEQAYQAAIEKSGGTIPVKIPVPQGEANVTPYVTKIPLDGSVDGVVLAAEPGGLAHDVAAIQQFAVSKKLPVAGVGTIEQFGGVYPDAVNGAIGNPTVHTSNPLPDNKDDQAFEAAWRTQLGKEGQLAEVFGGVSKGAPGQNGYAAYIALTSLKHAMIDAKFTGKGDTTKLISALESLNIPQGPDAPDGSIVMSKSDHQGRTTGFVFKINGQKDEIISTIPTDKIPPIGTCQV
jgi:ABC-type branched-subunit amino acid transport system substrate-binding protein